MNHMLGRATCARPALPFKLNESRDFAQRRGQPAPPGNDRHAQNFPAFFRQIPAYRPAEIFIERIESVGLEFTKHLPKLLLDSVHVVEESSPVHVQVPAAQLPVRSQEIVEFENPVFFFVQHAPADQAKIRHIFFILSPPDNPPIFAADLFQTNRADVLLLRDALPEPRVAGAEDPS